MILIRAKYNLHNMGFSSIEDRWFAFHYEGTDLAKSIEFFKKECMRAYREVLMAGKKDPLCSQKLRNLISFDSGHFIIRDRVDVLVFFDINYGADD